MGGKKALVGLSFFAAVLLFGIAAFFFPAYRNAREIGGGAGTLAGSAAGMAVGSYRGITEGIPGGLADGKRKGLSAEDTRVDVAGEMGEIGKLEVLVASVRLDDYHEIADDYKALYVYKADAVFTVDLKKAKIREEGGRLVILLEEPALTLTYNEDATEKIAEWQKHFYSGKTKDGYEAYLNSRREIAGKAPEEISNYEMLMELARESARKQVGILASAVHSGNAEVEVLFSGEEG